MFNRLSVSASPVRGTNMITIDVKTKAVTISNRYDADYKPMATNQFGDATPGYIRGGIKPNYPVPAIPIEIDLAQTARWHAVARAFQAKFAKR